MGSKSRQIKHRHRRRHAGGNPDNSVCPSLKTQDECVVCKWNAKTSKCGQAQKPGSKKASSPSHASSPKQKPKPKHAPAASKPGCPPLDKASCDSSPECSWNDKIGKCRKRTVKKAATNAKPKPKAKSKSPVKAAATVSPRKSKGPVEIPEDKEFREMNLEGADFSGMDLTDAFFFACKLKNAKFQNANLTSAKIRLCTLDGANFSGAKIINAEFKSCQVHNNRDKASLNPLVCINTVIKSTWIQGSEFANSNFSGTTFEHCDFDECETDGANFSGCKFTPSPSIKGIHALTIMTNCKFHLSNFTNADFRGCDFNSSEDTDLYECATDEDCMNHFNGCIFTGAKFPEKVNMCSFADAVLTGSDISDPKKDIQGCYFDATTEAEDVEELKRRAIPPEDDDDWMAPAKQKTPSPPRVKTPSPASPVKRAPSPKRAASPVAAAAAAVASANPKCIKQTQKKYLERPSPPYSATDCPGMTLPGNDGKVYVSVANAKGVYAWKLQK